MRLTTSKRAAAAADRPAPAAGTLLWHALQEPVRPRPTVVDAFALARRKWLAGERLELGALALELGIGRATMFRWVGTKERLIGEILWSMYEPILAKARDETPGQGPDYIAQVCERAMTATLRSRPLRRFIEEDPETALRILTSKSSPMQERTMVAIKALLDGQAAAGHIKPRLDTDTLAFVIVRIGESFVYADVISGREPAIDKAAATIRILLGGK